MAQESQSQDEFRLSSVAEMRAWRQRHNPIA
jgi:hypothetical protein